MSSVTITNNQLAIDFLEACTTKQSTEKLRQCTSKTFKYHSIWNYGKKVDFENVEQMIGAWKLAPWNNEIKDMKIEFIETDVIQSYHEEKPNLPNSSEFYEISLIWRFTFTEEKEEKKIDSVRVNTTVKKHAESPLPVQPEP